MPQVRAQGAQLLHHAAAIGRRGSDGVLRVSQVRTHVLAEQLGSPSGRALAGRPQLSIDYYGIH